MYDRQIANLMEKRGRFPSSREIHGVDECIPDAATLEDEDLAYIPKPREVEAFEKNFS